MTTYIITVFYLWGVAIAFGIAMGVDSNSKQLWYKLVMAILTSFFSWIVVGYAIGRLVNKT